MKDLHAISLTATAEDCITLRCLRDGVEIEYGFTMTCEEDARIISSYDKAFDEDSEGNPAAQLIKLAILNFDESRQSDIEIKGRKPTILQAIVLISKGKDEANADIYSVSFQCGENVRELEFSIVDSGENKIVSWKYGSYKAHKTDQSYWQVPNTSWSLHSLCSAMLRLQEAEQTSRLAS